ncbi:MAG: hypothetical protein GY940_24635 [bacterium]|nr:hypothetical protein [bacterium]
MSVFDSDGKFKNYMDIELSKRQKNNILKLIFFDDGTFCAIVTLRVDWEPKGKIFLTKETYSLFYFDQNGKLKATVYNTFKNGEVADKPRWGGPNIVFKPTILVRKTPEGNLCIGKTDENVFQFYNKKGVKIGTTTLEMDRILLSDSEFEKTKAALVAAYKKNSRMKWLARRMIKLKYKPIYHNFYLTRDYFIIFHLTKKNELGHTTETTLTLFDKNGTRKCTKKVDGYVMNILNNRLHIITYDDEGDESFRIEDLN